jgi:hypothetical protein
MSTKFMEEPLDDVPVVALPERLSEVCVVLLRVNVPVQSEFTL